MCPSPLRSGFVVALAVAGTGCYDDSAFLALTPGATGDSSSSSAGGASNTSSSSTLATTSGGGAGDSSSAADATGATSATDTGGSSDTAPEPVDPSPWVTFSASPTSITQAGPISIEVEHSTDVKALQLLDGDELVSSWAPNELPPEYLILSKQGLDARALRVRVVDDADQEALSEPVWIETDLPPPGTVLWSRSIDLGQPTEGRALSSGTNGSTALYVGADAGWEALSVRLNSEGKTAMVMKPIPAGQSMVGGLALDPQGDAILVGTQILDGKTRPWIARTTDVGDTEELHYGKSGDTATGVAVDSQTGRIYVSGYRKTPTTGIFDAMLWAHGPDGAPLWEKQWERPLPENKPIGDATDLAWDVAVVKNTDPNKADDVVLVGESRVELKKDELTYRAFVHRYSTAGAELATWMSSTPPLAEAGARCVFAQSDGGVMVGGWSSYDPEVVRSATIFFFTPLLLPQATHLNGSKGEQVVKDLARLPNDEIVYIADVDIEEEGRHDFELRSLETPLSDSLWSQPVIGADKTRGAGLAIASHGHIFVLGTETMQDTTALILWAIHP